MNTIFKSFLVTGLVSVLVGCGNSSQEPKVASEPEALPTVSVVEAVTQKVEQTSTYTSTVQAYVKNNIAPQSLNRISKINVEIGDFVKKGQVLAEMDQIQLQQAELQMLNNQTEYNRLKGLFEAGGLSQSDLDAIELAYKVSKTTYENLLENSVLVSPIDGVITARNYDVGDMFSMSLPLFTVEQIVPVKLLVAISESEYTKVKKGDSVEIKADAYPELTFAGKVDRIYPTIDPATRTFTVEVKVANRYKTLRPGMFARVKVCFGINDSVIVPDIAIIKQQGSGERFVYVLNEDNTVTYKKIKLGVRLGSEYEILEGLSAGEKVVTKGQIRLKDGVKVQVVE